MPFKKLGGGRYEGPSGKTFNLNQVRLYYANDGFPGQKKTGGGAMRKYQDGGAVADDDQDTPGVATGDPEVDQGAKNFNKSLRTMGAALPSIDSSKTFNEDFARNALGMSEDEIAQKKKGYAKGGEVKSVKYAEGGEVLTSRSRFMKIPDEFRTGKGVPQDYGKSGKGGALSKTEGDSKSEAPVKPRA